MGNDVRTSRPSMARAIPVRGAPNSRTSPRLHVPVVACLLSLLFLLSPDLTLAPIVAGEPHGSVISQDADQVRTPSRPGPLRPIDVEAGARIALAARPAAIEPTVAAVPSPVDPTVAAALEAARSYGEAFGITCAAVRDGQVLWSGAAGRYRDGATPIGGDDSLVIGSVMKTFVSAAILQLAEEGRLTLDDTVLSHLPHESAVTPDITIRQLLDHTSGLADVFNDTTKTGIETDPEHAWAETELMATLHAPWYRPGEGYAYANTNYYLLGLVVEKITGRSLADELSRRFFGPLGLDTARILTGKRGELLEPAWATIFWGSGAMSASAADLARWGDALYSDQVLTPASRSAMLATHNAENYGLGVQRIEVPGAAGYGHTGMLKTYTSLLLYLPDQNVTLSLLVNRTHVDLAGMLAARPPGGGPSLLELAGVKPPALVGAPPSGG
jgi:D-alanyl-D-alanine carboxypeptidase